MTVEQADPAGKHLVRLPCTFDGSECLAPVTIQASS
jgi:hypothetical protein